jgi:hypothetical protein
VSIDCRAYISKEEGEVGRPARQDGKASGGGTSGQRVPEHSSLIVWMSEAHTVEELSAQPKENPRRRQTQKSKCGRGSATGRYRRRNRRWPRSRVPRLSTSRDFRESKERQTQRRHWRPIGSQTTSSNDSNRREGQQEEEEERNRSKSTIPETVRAVQGILCMCDPLWPTRASQLAA